MLIPRRGLFAMLLGWFTPATKKQDLKFLHVMQVNYYECDNYRLMTKSDCSDLAKELLIFAEFNNINTQYEDAPVIHVRRGKFILAKYAFPDYYKNLLPETFQRYEISLQQLADEILSTHVFELGDILEIPYSQKYGGSSILVVTGV